VNEKLNLLAVYRDTVTEGKNRAQAFDTSKSFRDMQYSIMVFKAKVMTYSTEADKNMTIVVDILQKDINQLSNTWKTMRWNFLVLFKGIQDELQVTEPNEDVTGGQGIRELRQDLGDYRRRRREAAGQNVAVTKKIDELIQLANNFGVIWDLIIDIVMEIETKLLKISEFPVQIFYDRLSRLPGQYRGLMEALDIYAAAQDFSEGVMPVSRNSRLKNITSALKRLGA